MKLVADWKDAWRWFSVQALGVLAALPLVYATLPIEWQEWWRDAGGQGTLIVVLSIGGIAGRLIDQNNNKDEDND